MPLVHTSLYQALREANVPSDLAAEAAKASNFFASSYSSVERKLGICVMWRQHSDRFPYIATRMEKLAG